MTETSNTANQLGPDGKIIFADADRKKRGCWKYVLGAFLAVLLLVGGCTAFVFKSTTKPAKEASAFVKALMANDAKSAFARTSTGFREASTEGQLAEIAGRLSSIVGGAKLTNTGRSINAKSGAATTSTIRYKASKDGRTVYFTVTLIKAGDRWRVLNFDSSETDPASNNSSESTTDGAESNSADAVNSSTLG